MALTMYQVDAFASQVFEGNPAAVVPLTEWLPDQLMQNIAAENNLAETAFFVPTSIGFHIRWFTPTIEVALCGHATLASAYVLFTHLGYEKSEICFDSLSGELRVTKSDSVLTMDFPKEIIQPCSIPEALLEGLGKTPQACFNGQDIVAVFAEHEDVLNITPKLSELEKLSQRGVIITAPSKQYDFVARFFGPKCGIPEDPVTGSAYTQLAPYWSNRLGKQSMQARQLSSRGGDVKCELSGERVFISGTAVDYLVGEIFI